MIAGGASSIGTVFTEGGRDRLSMLLAYAGTGLPMLCIDPASKAPLDLRSSVQRGRDDTAEQSEAGDPGAKSRAGRHLATTSDVLLKRYWARATKDGGAEPNLAVSLGDPDDVARVRLVLVDGDTAEQSEAVQRFGDPENPDRYSMTTRSPGTKNAAGDWVHCDGGHWVYEVDIDLPFVDEFALPGGAVVSTHGRYFLVPPSERPEGKYVNVGPIRRMSDPSSKWLVDALLEQVALNGERAVERTEKAAARIERREAGEGVELSTSITEWADAHSWAELLTAQGWEPNHTGRNGKPLRSQRTDKCGCGTWTAPGDHADGKSATAHDEGCDTTRVDLDGGSGPLHIWTSSRPPGLTDMRRSRWTKAQFIADTQHGGDFRAFLSAEGIDPGSADLLDPSDYAIAGAMPTGDVAAEPVAALTDDEIESFWTSSPELATIRQFAWARLCSPWAVLACVLARVATKIPHTVALPPIVGGAASLNFFAALMGATGMGKGAADNAAAALTGPMGVFQTEIGSGEGIGHVYARRSARSSVTECVRSAALFTVPEIGNMNALMGRQASTLGPVLCKAWMSEALGNAYVDRTKALAIPKHSYRLALTAGVQPEHADVLFDAATSGLLQRFVWFPTTDKSIPLHTVEPDRLDLSHLERRWPSDPLAPPLSAAESDDDAAARAVMAEVDERALTLVAVDPAIRAELREIRHARAQGDQTVTAFDSHRGLSTLKLAAALSALENHGGDVDLETWARAGLLMRKSDETRAAAVHAITRAAAEKARTRIDTAVRTQVATTAAVESVRERNVTTRVLSIVAGAGVEGVSWGDLTRRNSSARDVLGDVLEKLIRDGRIYAAETEYHGRKGKRYAAI